MGKQSNNRNRRRNRRQPPGAEQLLAISKSDWPSTPDRIAFTHALNDLVRYFADTNSTGDEPEPNYFEFQDYQGISHRFSLSHERTLNVDTDDPHNYGMMALNTCLTANEFQKEAARIFRELDLTGYRGAKGDVVVAEERTRAKWYAIAVYQALESMASYGNTDYSIGLAWQQYVSDDSQQSKFVFTKLSRHQHWMGLNPALGDLENVGFLVFCDQYFPELPAFAVGIPETDALRLYQQTPFPPGQASTLRDLLAWHGAPSIWTGKVLGTEVTDDEHAEQTGTN